MKLEKCGINVMQEQMKTSHRDGFASLHGGLLARKGNAQPAIADLDLQRRSRRGDRDGEPVAVTPVAASSCSEKLHKAHAAPDKPRMTVRMTTRQQRLLRLVAAATDRSQQEILSMAIDQHLTKVIGEELGHCQCLRRLVLGDAGIREKAAS
ncbi:hypothetical protein DX908_02330 [Parvularcula marina]|uniref:Uncharacterized protein n=2 Tax=Parvularcula marina TaxID=2292771 RepID=A0A371RFI3_9PROT|nr:hypothetical protein DX908_02330 [Parvularcula marina]